MEETWFVERRGFNGRWRPELHKGDKPKEVSTGGERRVFRAEPRRVLGWWAKQPLEVVARYFKADEGGEDDQG